MDHAALSNLLTQLISHLESEVVEFKRGKDGFSSSDLGKYVSALANEANLRGRERAWLIFGVEDKTRVIVGTFDDYHYEEMVVGYLREFGHASRKELDELLRKKLSDVLNETQKTHKIGNLLSALRRKGRIRNFGSTASPEWRLVE